ncbi:MAG: hypothetical protein Kow00105_13680 [Phycisphaeraceae bacterium]
MVSQGMDPWGNRGINWKPGLASIGGGASNATSRSKRSAEWGSWISVPVH